MTRIEQIDATLARLDKRYREKMERMSGRVPPPIVANALAGIARQMDRLDAERTTLNPAKPGAMS